MKTALFLMAISLGMVLRAQTDLRTEEMERMRGQRTLQLAPDEASRGERTFVKWKNSPVLNGIIGKGVGGVRLGLGGMYPGAGFAAGPDYSRSDLLGERLTVAASARVATSRSYLGTATIATPDLFSGYVFTALSVTHRNYSQMPFYGPGPESAKTGRSAYRLEDTLVEFRPGVKPLRRLQLGAIGGFYRANVGPGDASRFISSELQFDPEAAPGIDRQGSFWKTGAFAIYDRRRGGTEPTGGFRYEGEWARFSDRTFKAYSHSRLDMDVQHYIPFFNEKRVIAIHGHSTLTDIRKGQAMPFYLQPTVGGAETLRGYRPFRFTGANAMWMNAEYRWETSLGMDVAVFADAGKVFDRWSQLNMHDLESSVGFGFRFKMRQNLAMRLDTGFSHEGFQVWFRFNNVF